MSTYCGPGLFVFPKGCNAAKDTPDDGSATHPQHGENSSRRIGGVPGIGKNVVINIFGGSGEAENQNAKDEACDDAKNGTHDTFVNYAIKKGFANHSF